MVLFAGGRKSAALMSRMGAESERPLRRATPTNAARLARIPLQKMKKKKQKG
jgi:hypothetical protein